jgi:hypothetical protein
VRRGALYRKKQRIEPSIIEAFADVSPRGGGLLVTYTDVTDAIVDDPRCGGAVVWLALTMIVGHVFFRQVSASTCWSS